MNLTSSRARLSFVLAAVLLFAFAFTSFLNFEVTKRSLRLTTMTETLPLISDTVYSEIQASLLRPIHNSSLMANDSFLKQWILDGENDIDQVVQYLRLIRDQYDYFSAFFVSAQTGNYYYYDGILKQVSRDDPHDVWFYGFSERDTDYELDVDTDEASGGVLTVFINHRLRGPDGEYLGVTGVGLKMDNLGATLRTFGDRYAHLIYMVDSTGFIQVHQDKSLIEKVSIADLEGMEMAAGKILASKSKTQTHELERDGERIYLSTRFFDSFGWYLIVEEKAAESLGSARKTLMANLLIGAAATGLVLLVVVSVINRFQKHLRHMATTDPLTGLNNRRHFMEMAEHEKALAQRYRHPVSLMFLDVDHFKRVNDTRGHEAGDDVLRILAETVRSTVRNVDIAGRLGGEEFVVLLPRSDAGEAVHVAERLREAVEETVWEERAGVPAITISIGVASQAPDVVDITALLKQADHAMYTAKEKGRNRVHLHGDPVAPA